MRLAIHDYCGHPFQVQLSRELARRGHRVVHLYCPSVSSAHGAIDESPSDPPTFSVDPIVLGRPFDKYHPTRRSIQELDYGRRLVQWVHGFDPDVVLSANTPLLCQLQLVRAAARDQFRFVYWQQDALGAGIRYALRSRWGPLGEVIGRGFESLEARLLRASDAVVTISDDFTPMLEAAGVAADSVNVVENWAPLEELPLRPRNNRWAVEHGLVDRPVLLYAGTLGMKHNPRLLLHLAESLEGSGAVVVVVSEGLGADWLRDQATTRSNLVQFPYQPYDFLPDVLATGDVLIAVLEPEAGLFSVPSKVLSYLCAGRPILAAVPPGNLAARVVERSGAGLAVDPADVDGFVAAGRELLADSTRGAAARDYAERTFDIATIGDRFEAILSSAPSAAAPLLFS